MNGNFLSMVVIKVMPSSTIGIVLFSSKKEQAEVGQSPTLLALRYRYGVLRILRGYFTAFLPAKKKNTGYPAVSCIGI